MDKIYIKAVNGGYIVKGMIRNQISFYKLLKEKLEICVAHSASNIPVFFDIENCQKEDYQMIFDICAQCNVICAGFITEKIKELKVIESRFYAGESYFFDSAVLIINEVPRDTMIICLSDVFVIHKVSGKIDVYDKNAKVVASDYNHAQIRIFDSTFQNVTNHAGGILYYDEGEVKHQLRREIDGRSNCYHIR